MEKREGGVWAGWRRRRVSSLWGLRWRWFKFLTSKTAAGISSMHAPHTHAGGVYGALHLDVQKRRPEE